MKLDKLKETLLLKPGTYVAQIVDVNVVDSKSRPGARNTNVELDVFTNAGNTVKIWDLLPDPDKTPKAAFRHMQYADALGLNLAQDFDLTTATFATLLTRAKEDGALVTINVVKVPASGNYPESRKVSKVSQCGDVDPEVERAIRYDGDTDSALTPDRTSATGEQSLAADPDIS
jgi:hypothetical protein